MKASIPAQPEMGKLFNLEILLLLIPPRAIAGILNNFTNSPNFIIPKPFLFLCDVVSKTGEINTFYSIIFTFAICCNVLANISTGILY